MHFIEKEPSQKREDFVRKLMTNKILRVPGASSQLEEDRQTMGI